MNTKFKAFVDWSGGVHDAAEKLQCSESLVRHLISGRRNITKKIAIRAHKASDGKFDKTALMFSDIAA